MEMKGKLVTCNRCGSVIFLEYDETVTSYGGFEKQDYFAKYPAGWNWYEETGRLCPACDSEWMELVTKFMTEKPRKKLCDIINFAQKKEEKQ